jgi:hypothetical protein
VCDHLTVGDSRRLRVCVAQGREDGLVRNAGAMRIWTWSEPDAGLEGLDRSGKVGRLSMQGRRQSRSRWHREEIMQDDKVGRGRKESDTRKKAEGCIAGVDTSTIRRRHGLSDSKPLEDQKGQTPDLLVIDSPPRGAFWA